MGDGAEPTAAELQTKALNTYKKGHDGRVPVTGECTSLYRLIRGSGYYNQFISAVHECMSIRDIQL